MQIPIGIFTVEEAGRVGLSRQKLAELVKTGVLERLSRGLYSRIGGADMANLEMVVLAKRGYDFVVALESALRFHGFTAVSPTRLWVALRRGARRPAVDLPLEVIRVGNGPFASGVERCDVGGVSVKVYSAAKTVADLFKFRNAVGLEVALDALREGWRKRLFSIDELMEYARIDRVVNVMMPYVEGLVA